MTTQLEDLKMAATDFHFSAGIVVLPPREQVFGLYPNSDYQKRLRRLADQDADVEFGRVEHRPRGWQERAVQRHHDDDEAFEPHSNVYQNRNYKKYSHAVADLLKPQHLGSNHIAQHHQVKALDPSGLEKHDTVQYRHGYRQSSQYSFHPASTGHY